MDEEQRQKRFRETEENATKRRAEILGVEYLDTRDIEATTPLYPDMLAKG
jgi:hypothetical protein